MALSPEVWRRRGARARPARQARFFGGIEPLFENDGEIEEALRALLSAAGHVRKTG
jgi:hypothetical protein